MHKYDVAAYVWPAYTGDEPRSRIFWKEGIGEWQTVMNTNKRYPNDSWPRRPIWGYVNEADPYVMEMQIEAALDHGVNVFLYDWYWYDGRPFLEQCLNNGFLKARNNKKMKFYLMWANHDATSMWNKEISDWGVKNNDVIWRGGVYDLPFQDINSRPWRNTLITINSWNEWTETSFLEPDSLYGYGYLEAVKRVFCE